MHTALALWAVSALIGATEPAPSFISAKPIWPEGRDTEMNLLVGFRAGFEAPESGRTVLRVTGASLYRAFVNGQFAGHGPARGPHGWFRVDEWDISGLVEQGRNHVAIEVAGYNVNSYYLPDQPAFLQAEIVTRGKVLASTGGDGSVFEATVLKERVQKTQRYSFQRTFSEVYRLRPGYDRWRQYPGAPIEPAKCAVAEAKNLLPRRVPYPTFNQRPVLWHVSRGTIKTGVEVKSPWKDRALVNVGPQFKGYKESDLEVIPSLELQAIATATRTPVDRALDSSVSLPLSANSFQIVDFGTNLTGFLGAKISCRVRTRLFFTFDEILRDQDVDFKRLGCVNIIEYTLEPGDYVVESLEPYTLRYAKLITFAGECEVEGVYLREYANPDVWGAHFAAADPRLNRLFAAARETFAQNSADLFMDCPSRERAGWLCDSFWTARTAYDLSGHTAVEEAFIENYLLPTRFEFLPGGMIPMCYPADHNDTVFIPNWAMWLVIELEEYLARSGDRSMVDALQGRLSGLHEFFRQYENSDGLLEKLPSWVFVEWSDANKYVQDVNYPSNMLYAAVLAAGGRVFGMVDLVEKADRIREAIRKQAFDGEFFVDNAIRKDGKLEVTRNRTEVCQYYAFFFDAATPKSHERLWNLLRTEFGPRRKATGKHPEISKTNQFPGNFLRLELLSREGLCQQVLDESVDYNLYMADRTGTLWENDGDYASCNHGFASHVAHILFRDVLGVYRVDAVEQVVTLRFADLKMDWCEGRVPARGGAVNLRWWKEGERLLYRIDTPAGFKVEVRNLTGRPLVRQP
ncbi:MAG TPA: hypothetical protein PKY77_02825 [Phycisphaerae bacterium]|nr:hypothetical protein [Phycisphaerae bacterium]HRY66679.1 hypothetical protein [Phycisphaerae bacterium]HSA27618.1 hypothetical protein [Phycisphaerae bacterium]